MPDAWRIDGAKRASTSFSGQGAALAGGRWNPAGVPVVYASEHLSTAALEKLVHLPKPIPEGMRFVRFALEFRETPLERPSASSLPANWQAEPVPVETQEFGLEWFKSGRTAVLAVPSALIPEEMNFVINPAHPDFARIAVSPSEQFVFAPRLAELRSS